jgi:hypothetical protein
MKPLIRPLHHWTGYGTLCHTTDARKADSQVAADREHVTCERCLTLLAMLDGQRTADSATPRESENAV